MDDTSIIEEIHKLIDGKIAMGVIVRADWIAAGILDLKSNIDGEDVQFYRVCAYRDVLRTAKRAIGKYEADESTPDQLLLPGFKHLCKAYPMVRDGVPMIVPVDQCTEAELRGRVADLEKMAKGCRAHAREILDYIAARKSDAA